MKRHLLAALLTAGALAAAPAIAQQTQQKETVPLQVPSKQVTELQQKLHQQNLYTGPIDGNWGPETQAAVKNFQKKEGLTETGKLDQQTMSKLGLDLSSGGSSASSGSGSSQMSEQQAEQKLQQQGFSQIQLEQQNGKLEGTASKGGQQYHVAVSQDGQVMTTPQQ